MPTRLAYRAIALLCGADRDLACSRDVQRFYPSECGVAPSRICYQPYPVDNDVYRVPSADERQQAAFGLTEQALVLVLPARLKLVKGYDIVVDAVRELLIACPELPVVALFAGSGYQRAEIEHYAFATARICNRFTFLAL